MMPQPCPRMSSLIRPFAGVPACTGFEGPMLLGRGISGASGDDGREIAKRKRAVILSVQPCGKGVQRKPRAIRYSTPLFHHSTPYSTVRTAQAAVIPA